ncbi:hypothetical protein [Streptomyces sp. 6N223]|uniref:hypothetical protein n=1 Tax=Streptomyces sp. 6N223 TaxID=3457412 RepID=UPI003FD447CC
MGSLRRPVGPLPSSIYWRRRLVVLLGIALIVLLVVWAWNSVGGGGGDDTEPAGDGKGGGPAESITPGPTPSESFIDERPGGREEPEPDPETEPEPDPSDDDGTGDAGDSGDAGGGTGGSGGTASGGGAGGGGTDDAEGLAACAPGDVSLSLSSAENEYGLDEVPELVLTVENVSGVSCAVDFGYSALTVTITDAGAEQVWSSADCPDGAASLPTAVWADDSATYTIEWDRYHSTGDCDPARGPAAAAGTSYLAEATLSGFPDVPQAPFRLDND